jgi:signal transduction histidine kinase/ActR/RegA family two-component response regulator
MLAAVLRAEQQAAFAIAEATEARRAARRAHAVSEALEAARAGGAKLNAELREEHRRKDDFLAMLAHELRNPLMPLVTAIDLLRRAPDARAAARYLDIMARQTGQMSRLVEDLLDVSRVSRGRIELRRHRILLNDVLRDAVEASRPTLQLRRHELKVSMADEELPVNGDGVRLTQVFSNLLHNAAKYTDPNGRIEVATFRDHDHAVARIRDNGIGIAPEMLPRVFDLFAQAPVSLDRSQGGLGIGLTLVRALIELHGGEVVADSEGLGRGSVFTVRLPIMERAAPRAEPPPAQPSVPESERSLRVLVVDDNEDAANSLADILRLTGHHAEVAFSGAKALQAATDLDVDLVLLDIGLPDMDGFEVATRLRRVVRRGSRLVAVTGYGTAEDRRRAVEAGFDEHVVKPVMSETLAAVLHRAQSTNAAARMEGVVDASTASDRNLA